MPGFELFGQEERDEVEEVLETGVLMRYGFDAARKDRWKARSFEQMLAKRLGVAHCHLVGSGTAALDVALNACGIGAGDEVIVPPFTFVATFEAILKAGAVPVFAEIDDTLCLDPSAVEAAITEKTRAVMPVHMCGAMARIDQLQHLCQQRGLTLIEDACQALGGTFHGKALGTFGLAGCFSFDPVKTITCGEGGAVVTDDARVYELAQAYADHGHDHIGNDRGLEKHPILGTNHRISELNAAVGVAQLRKLDTILQIQRSRKQILVSALSAVDGVRFRTIPDEAGDTATFLTFFLPDEERARKAAAALPEAGVDGCFYWFDNNWHYIRSWDHLKRFSSPAKLPVQLLSERPDYRRLALPQSDAVMGRAVSMLIKLGWSETETQERAEKTVEVLRGIL
ncbi:MAG: DegT/DnrJ/EryC1/StrS family aminotransferase [Desulfobacteraceae bacterium]|nr:DegT/DnrJ/EryC1/StrS family aminotransferase [Desulfobacteraceae bacterium]